LARGEKRLEAAAPVSGGDLDRLMQAEERLQAMLTAAESAAAGQVAEARRTNEQALGEFEEQLATALRALEARVAAGRDTELASIQQRFAAEAARFREVPGERVRQIAALLLEHLLQPSRPEAADDSVFPGAAR